MREIYSGLIGDYYRDRAYLLKNKETYKSNKFYSQIEPKINELLKNMEPVKKKVIREETKEEKIKRINSLYDGAIKYFDEKIFEKAKKQMEYIFSKYKEFFIFDNKCIKLSFADTIEMWLYIAYYKPSREVYLTEVDNSDFYRIYGKILFELENYNEAIKAFKLSLKWDPVNVDALINISEVYYQLKEEDAFLKHIKLALEFATCKEDLAICYKYLGNYYLEKDQYELSISLYSLSNSIVSNRSKEEDQKLQDRMKFLQRIIGNKYKGKTQSELALLLKNNKINCGPSKIVVNTLKNLIKQSAVNDAPEIEEYCTDKLIRLLSY